MDAQYSSFGQTNEVSVFNAFRVRFVRSILQVNGDLKGKTAPYFSKWVRFLDGTVYPQTNF